MTSIDWRTHPQSAAGVEVPEIEGVLVNRADVDARGAGETAITIVAAAIGNAIFDATGARVREVPFTPERVKAALRRERLIETAVQTRSPPSASCADARRRRIATTTNVDPHERGRDELCEPPTVGRDRGKAWRRDDSTLLTWLASL